MVVVDAKVSHKAVHFIWVNNVVRINIYIILLFQWLSF
jgi:hypothetical protein